jgi:site-specific recombinase XerD
MRTHFAGYESVFSAQIERYIAFKRALNRRYVSEEYALRLFDRYAAAHDIRALTDVSAEVVSAFLASRPRTRPRSYNHLLGVLRQWFGWMVQQGYLPVGPAFPRPRRSTGQRIPFLFDQTLAKRLLAVTAKLPDRPKGPARAITYRMIFLLLYGLGLRVGEVSRLRCEDVDLHRNLLIIRESKFGKSRLVPFGPKMATELVGYLQQRQARCTNLASNSPLFSFTANRAVNPTSISLTFHHLLPSLNLEIPPGVAAPRLHGLRHSFAVGTLLRWYRSGVSPGDRLLQLSTFMGHVDPDSTAIYLTITSELLDAANNRFEHFASHGSIQS